MSTTTTTTIENTVGALIEEAIAEQTANDKPSKGKPSKADKGKPSKADKADKPTINPATIDVDAVVANAGRSASRSDYEYRSGNLVLTRSKTRGWLVGFGGRNSIMLVTFHGWQQHYGLMALPAFAADYRNICATVAKNEMKCYEDEVKAASNTPKFT